MHSIGCFENVYDVFHPLFYTLIWKIKILFLYLHTKGNY